MVANTRRVTGMAALPIIGTVFSAMAVLLLLAAGGLVLWERHAGHDAAAEGIVIKAGPRPLIRFVDAGGTAITFRSTVRAGLREAGERVPVAYAPGQPHDAVIDTLLNRWTLPVILGIVSSIFLCVATGFGLIGRLRAAPGNEPTPASAPVNRAGAVSLPIDD